MAQFGPVLKELRLGRRPVLSQSKLGERAGFDHSYISRLESGSRVPTRAAVLSIIEALGLDVVEGDRLLIAAGFSPLDESSLFVDEPVLNELLIVFRNQEIAEHVKEDLRELLWVAIRQASRSGSRSLPRTTAIFPAVAP